MQQHVRNINTEAGLQQHGKLVHNPANGANHTDEHSVSKAPSALAAPHCRLAALLPRIRCLAHALDPNTHTQGLLMGSRGLCTAAHT